MELIDTHCHIHEALRRVTSVYDKWHEKDGINPDEMIAAATEAGVGRLICVGATLADSELAIEFVKNRPNCWASIGIHPHEAKNHLNGGVEKEFASLANAKKVVAIGECGLDYFYNHSSKETQFEVLRFQIELALKHDLPMIFHVREAFDDFWPVFESFSEKQKIHGVLHSFTDSIENMEKAIEYGLYIGVNGIATFSKDHELYRAIPLENLLLETDAPFLTPVPHRGRINEPKYTRVTAEYLAGLRNEPLAELAESTTANVTRLFRI